MNEITVLVVEPGKKPYVKSIPSGLASLQHEVGGYIQAIYPWADDPCAIVCDEEAKLKGKPMNRALRDEDGHIYDIVAGTFLIIGLDSERFTSLESKYIQKYSTLFAFPEVFLHIDERIIVIPVEDASCSTR